MKRTSWLALGVVLGFVGFGATEGARAQQGCVPTTPTSAVVGSGGAATTSGVGVQVSRGPIQSAPVVEGAWPGSAGSFGAASGMGARSGAIMPYSYYANFPDPARIYVGYGPNDGFPFQGDFYGHAGDRWSWSAMSTGNGSLARYYYQILR